MADRSKLDDIQIEIDRTKDVMKKNIEVTLDRGDRLDDMEAKADRLNTHAQHFKKRTAAVKRAHCWQSYRNGFFIFLIFAVIILIVLYAAGVFSGSDESGSGGN